MPKSQHNSSRCLCCSRFMPRKSGKRIYCSEHCRQADYGAQARARALARMARVNLQRSFAPALTRSG